MRKQDHLRPDNSGGLVDQVGVLLDDSVVDLLSSDHRLHVCFPGLLLSMS